MKYITRRAITARGARRIQLVLIWLTRLLLPCNAIRDGVAGQLGEGAERGDGRIGGVRREVQ